MKAGNGARQGGRLPTAAATAAAAAAHAPIPPKGAALVTGTVVAAHGRHYFVAPAGDAAPGQPLIQCFPRGKKSDIAVGDNITFEPRSANQGVIVEILPRRNLFYRSDQFRSKLFAANIDQLMIVVATIPHFSDDLISRAVVAAEAQGIEPWFVLNKIDMADNLAYARGRLAPYRALGYHVSEVSVLAQPEQTLALLGPRLVDRATLLVGQSGMGKSTLVNLLVPDAAAATREISAALHSGRHTTTFTRLYRIPQNGGLLIDSPGFQEFGLHHLSEGKLERAFPEFRPLLGGCRFYNCHHLHEPGCAILAALADGRIAPARHALYAQLVHESSQVGHSG